MKTHDDVSQALESLHGKATAAARILSQADKANTSRDAPRSAVLLLMELADDIDTLRALHLSVVMCIPAHT